MIDREKIIDGLEKEAMACGDYVQLPLWVYSSVLSLLKEQKAVKPMKQIEQNEWTVCGVCKNHLISKWQFCPYCGRSVKWE